MARRLPSRLLPRVARRAWLAACLIAGGAAAADTIVEARYAEPTSRYAHGILGDAIEWGALELLVEDSAHKTKRIIRLPKDRVFEDVAPRLADVDGDGKPEVVVVETQVNTGAQLAIYDETGKKIAATPHIGRANRWLAPVGVADLDGDGQIELAYIDRPHLAKILRIWRYRDGALEHVADQPGLTNHRIGERDIGGGLRLCGGTPEMITASADWRRVIATRFDGTSFTMRDLGPHKDRQSLTAALGCS
ncbi:Repeat domain-containing protein [Litoreibacter ascidiaceicola]|uniref:Repeat domain-containing protein n=1 Tax=Litoreibacter ascidiaceicola TaxID=1486859 RepID=A0A1M4TB85_9RHOB|nr:VCBS repeat-containing protein [Litoreibacter ascidiaceicola]SHE41614.1 Repeat domain-containing protein [Litoreibacter ascidiaceicola]